MKIPESATLFIFLLLPIMFSCSGPKQPKKEFFQANEKMVRLITVDPGHFHAALVQKTMYEQVSGDVHVYAPEGYDLKEHLGRINAYNSRLLNPTKWNEIVYTGSDYFEKMISEKAGNVVILSGNNRKKAEYIEKSVQAGLNVLADKPMIIRASDFPELEEAFREAEKNKVLLYDIMTERYEIATILQREFSRNEEVFGKLLEGTKDDPAVTKVSVHHFSKVVSGVSLIRPAWFFDTEQQGEGIVDVTTHLVDLIQWESYPDSILNKDDVKLVSARRWPTCITEEDFRNVTGLHEFPSFLEKDVKDGKLNVFSNGEFTYRLKKTWAKVSVEWKFQAPTGGGDTHYSVMRGSKCTLIIKQTVDEKYLPTLYVEINKSDNIDDFSAKLTAVLGRMPYDSLSADKLNEKVLRVNIPSKYRVGHEEHFSQVTSRFLEYLKEGKLPEWEVAGILTKYYTTTSALELARK